MRWRQVRDKKVGVGKKKGGGGKRQVTSFPIPTIPGSATASFLAPFPRYG